MCVTYLVLLILILLILVAVRFPCIPIVGFIRPSQSVLEAIELIGHKLESHCSSQSDRSPCGHALWLSIVVIVVVFVPVYYHYDYDYYIAHWLPI